MRKASLPNEINVHSAFLFRIVLPTVAVYTFRLMGYTYDRITF